MKYFDKEITKKAVLDFTIKGVETFLKEHPALEFYAFAYTCNAEYGEICLSFNTEPYYEKLFNNLKIKYPEDFKTEEEIRYFRYTTGDWEYQCFDCFSVLSDEETTKIFEAVPDEELDDFANAFIETIMEFFNDCLLDFKQTDTYRKIPKTKEFIAYAIDHDEDPKLLDERFKKLLNQI